MHYMTYAWPYSKESNIECIHNAKDTEVKSVEPCTHTGKFLLDENAARQA